MILDIVLNHTGDVFAYPGGAATATYSSTPYPVEWRDAGGQPQPQWTEPPPDPAPDAAVWPAELQHSEYFTRQGMARDTVGEVYDSEDTISRFIGRQTSAPGEDPSVVGIDAALDYPLFFVLPGVAKGLAPPAGLSDMFSHRIAVQDGLLSSHGEASRYYVSFLDNHDQPSRFYYDDGQGTYAGQVPLGLALLFFLPGIPCVYYGTEAGLHGSGGNESVREALWGDPGAFDLAKLPFAEPIQQLTAVRDAHPALRYGRHYARPVSGNGQDFGTGVWPDGIVAFSRILYDTEALVVANPSTSQTWHGYVIVDRDLNPPGGALRALWPAGAADLPVSQQANVTITEPDGSSGTGPVNVVAVQLAPMQAMVAISAPSTGF